MSTSKEKILSDLKEKISIIKSQFAEKRKKNSIESNARNTEINIIPNPLNIHTNQKSIESVSSISTLKNNNQIQQKIKRKMSNQVNEITNGNIYKSNETNRNKTSNNLLQKLNKKYIFTKYCNNKNKKNINGNRYFIANLNEHLKLVLNNFYKKEKPNKNEKQKEKILNKLYNQINTKYNNYNNTYNYNKSIKEKKSEIIMKSVNNLKKHKKNNTNIYDKDRFIKQISFNFNNYQDFNLDLEHFSTKNKTLHKSSSKKNTIFSEISNAFVNEKNSIINKKENKLKDFNNKNINNFSISKLNSTKSRIEESYEKLLTSFNIITKKRNLSYFDYKKRRMNSFFEERNNISSLISPGIMKIRTITPKINESKIKNINGNKNIMKLDMDINSFYKKIAVPKQNIFRELKPNNFLRVSHKSNKSDISYLFTNSKHNMTLTNKNNYILTSTFMTNKKLRLSRHNEKIRENKIKATNLNKLKIPVHRIKMNLRK